MVGKISHPSSCAQLEFYFNILIIYIPSKMKEPLLGNACQAKGEIFVISGSNIAQLKKSCSL